MKYLRTSQVAERVGLHPNTIRLYEEWGWLPPIPRTQSGYRQYTEYHIDQVRLIRYAMRFTFLTGEIHRAGRELIRLGANGEVAKAYAKAENLAELVRKERARAEDAVEVLENWVREGKADSAGESLQIKQVLTHLDISYDMLRNWERNGLIEIPRDPGNGYRVFGEVELNRLRVIRVLRRARYSLMSILRMLIRLDQGQRENLRQVLDTPDPEEDIVYATDQWLTRLGELEDQAERMAAHLRLMIGRYGDVTPLARQANR